MSCLKDLFSCIRKTENTIDLSTHQAKEHSELIARHAKEKAKLAELHARQLAQIASLHILDNYRYTQNIRNVYIKMYTIEK